MRSYLRFGDLVLLQHGVSSDVNDLRFFFSHGFVYPTVSLERYEDIVKTHLNEGELSSSLR